MTVLSLLMSPELLSRNVSTFPKDRSDAVEDRSILRRNKFITFPVVHPWTSPSWEVQNEA
ncbi:hypothetical protein LguiA_008250 [Lonicera macranthoides]